MAILSQAQGSELAINGVEVEPDSRRSLSRLESPLIAARAARIANMGHRFVIFTVVAVLLFVVGSLWACGGDADFAATDTRTPPTHTSRSPTPVPTSRVAAADQEFNIVTLLEFDAIRSIDNPEFLTAAEAEDIYPPNEKVIGVSINGDNRAYSVPMLSRHEIVNDTVGGVKIAVTW